MILRKMQEHPHNAKGSFRLTTSLPSRSPFQANSLLSSQMRVLLLSDGAPARTITKVHLLLKRGDDLKIVLQEALP